MNKQFVVPQVTLVPVHFVSLANMWTIACTNNPVFTRRNYDDLASRLRNGLVPSLRVSTSGVVSGAKRQGGQIFFNPRFATARLVGVEQAKVIEELADYKFIPATARSVEGRRQAALLSEDFKFTPAAPAPQQVKLVFDEVADVAFHEAVEVSAKSALTDTPNLAERLVAGIEDVKGTNSEMLAALRENTAVMQKLLAVWQPGA
jgi:hypothetical protein